MTETFQFRIIFWIFIVSFNLNVSAVEKGERFYPDFGETFKNVEI